MHNSRILIVEDEGIAAMNMEAKLQELGYISAGIAFSGEQAIEMCRDNHPDLVMMDVQLKGEMSGITAAQQIQKQLDVPVIFVTAFSDDATIRAAKKTFPYGFLVKPVGDHSIKPSVEMAIEKHRLEKELSLSQRRYETLFYQIPTGAAIIDKNFLISSANPALARLLGYSQPSELQDKHILDYVGNEGGQEFQRLFSKVGHILPVSKPLELKLLPAVKDGVAKAIWVSVVSAQVQDPKSGERMGLFLFSDISSQKAIERDLRSKATHLAVSNTELENFASFAAEDLQTPTRKIVNLIERLRFEHSSKSPFTRGRLQIDLEREAEELRKLVADMLNFAKACPAPKELKKVPLMRVFREAMDELRDSIQTSKAKVTHEFLPTVFGDERQLRRLFINLISNSLKFCDGAPSISVSSQEEEKFFRVSVEDQGIGILPDDLPHVFEIFHKGQTEQKYQGSGIGLASCRKIMENIGGKITVESNRGKGTKFILDFPKGAVDAHYSI